MNIAKSVTDAFEIPYEAVFDVPRIVIAGDERVCVENYTAILEYKKDNIKLKYKSGVIEICGSGFEITALSDGNIAVSGKISAVKLI